MPKIKLKKKKKRVREGQRIARMIFEVHRHDRVYRRLGALPAPPDDDEARPALVKRLHRRPGAFVLHRDPQIDANDLVVRDGSARSRLDRSRRHGVGAKRTQRPPKFDTAAVSFCDDSSSERTHCDMG